MSFSLFMIMLSWFLRGYHEPLLTMLTDALMIIIAMAIRAMVIGFAVFLILKLGKVQSGLIYVISTTYLVFAAGYAIYQVIFITSILAENTAFLSAVNFTAVVDLLLILNVIMQGLILRESLAYKKKLSLTTANIVLLVFCGIYLALFGS